MKTQIHCRTCGDLFTVHHPNQRLCVNCRNESLRKPELVAQDGEKKKAGKPKHTIKLVDSYCRGCVYRSYMPGAHMHGCMYIGYTGKKRPCPAGKDCTVKKGKRA